MTDITGGSTPLGGRGESFAFGSIFVVGFVIFLGVALLAQLLTSDWRLWLPGAEAEKSIVGGVRAAVYTFMSYLT